MEMRRRGERPRLRNVSLSAFYKYLSGYGERSGLALALLLGWIFVVFPTAYLALGAFDTLPRAVLHSLEVSTFLSPARELALDVPGRLSRALSACSYRCRPRCSRSRCADASRGAEAMRGSLLPHASPRARRSAGVSRPPHARRGASVPRAMCRKRRHRLAT
jgi:hypothetical protein